MENEKRLIDANALQRRICGAKCGCEYEDCGCEGDCQFDFFISNAPAVDAVEVVHGQWVYSGEPDDDGNIQAHCSVCDAGDRHAPCMIGHVPYCWKCGARMDLKGE